MADKNYIKGIFIKEGKYDLRVSINLETFFESLEPIQNDKGYANILIKKRKEEGKFGDTHYCIENDWKPNKEGTANTEIVNSSSEGDEDLPF